LSTRRNSSKPRNRDDADRRPVAPASVAGAARARHIDHLEQLVLPPALHSDLWVKQLHLPEYTGFVATLIGGLILAIGCPLAGHWSDKTARTKIMVISCGLFVLTPTGLLPDGRLAVAGGLRHRRRLAPTGQGWLQRRSAVAVVRAVPGETRAIGVSLGFSTAVSIFGGLRRSSQPG